MMQYRSNSRKQNMRARIATIVFTLTLLVIFGCDGPTDPQLDIGYEIGDFQLRDTGPAGGFIFYIDEADEFDWTFLEAAPEDAETKYHWGPKVNNFPTGTDIGTGAANTRMIVDYFNENGISGKAAQYCDGLTCGGCSDWFLPSQDELDAMIVELYQYDGNSNVGGLSGGFYWCSSDLGKDYATMLRVATGVEWSSIKNYSYNVRAIRAF
jgi:hypothetical protein